MKTFLKTVPLAVAALAGLSAKADVAYNTFPNYNNAAFSVINNQSIGNEIYLSSGLIVTNFQIEYYSPNSSFSGSVGIDVSFYNNNGAPFNGYATPGTKIYDSGFFNGLPANGFQVVNYTMSDLYTNALLPLTTGFMMPSNFTFVITFQGLGGGDTLQLPLAYPVTTGPATGFGDYWLNTGSSWELLTNSSTASFVAEIDGVVSQTPEPSAVALAAAGGALFLVGAMLRKRSQNQAAVNG